MDNIITIARAEYERLIELEKENRELKELLVRTSRRLEEKEAYIDELNSAGLDHWDGTEYADDEYREWFAKNRTYEEWKSELGFSKKEYNNYK